MFEQFSSPYGKPVEDVQTGEVKVADASRILVSNAIGSCIACVILDPLSRVGGIAHIMLPGSAPAGYCGLTTRYAWNGFSRLLDIVIAGGGVRENLLVCLAGGANVLLDPSDTVCLANIESVRFFCELAQLDIQAQSLGGCSRRRLVLDPGRPWVLCSIGNGDEFILWSGRGENQ
jgi:chemotaxis protein CheD